MNLFRLGDRLDQASLDMRKPYFQTADNLAKRIFNTVLKDNYLDDYYIQSAKRSGAEGKTGTENGLEIFANLGEYERKIIGKILESERKALCIVGPHGCGKTTTIHYLVNKLQKWPHLDCGMNGQTMISLIDFNERLFHTIKDEKEASEILLTELCEKIDARMKVHRVPSRVEQFTHFWGEEIERLRSGELCDTPSTAFVRIVTLMSEKSLSAMPPLTEEELQKREQILVQLKQNKDVYLDYLVRLWGYVIRAYYKGNSGCAFLVFDNIDTASPIVQSVLLSIVQACARDPGPTYVLLVRPETFDRLGMGSDVIDVEEHRGLLPSHIVTDRLKRFVENPNNYFSARDGLKQAEFDLIKDFLMRVYQVITADGQRHLPYLTFLNKACGKSLRLALLTAQNLLKASEYEMRDPDISVYSLVRLAVTQGEQQFRSAQRSPIANLFHVRGGEDGRLLIKPRILKFLAASPEHRNTLNEIRHTIKAFGYPETTLLREAINEMMNVYCQLLRSDGFNSYSEHEFLNAGTEQITMTEIGRGYENHLLYSVDYVQEVMLDSYVRPDRFGLAINYSYLPEKFMLLVKFLQELGLADIDETSHFVQHRGKRTYFDIFGNYLISLELTWKIHGAILRIIRSLHQQTQSLDPRHAGRRLPYREIEEQFDSLLKQMANDNNRILGIWPEEYVLNHKESATR